MKNRHLVVWAWGLGAISAVVACAPEVTVSKDDSPGGEGGSDVVTTVGGSSSVAGSGGSRPAQSGSSGSSGSGGSAAVAAGRGGTGGDDSFVSAGAPGVPENCPCTRRPTAPVSQYCPRGSGLSTEVVIGPEGGEGELGNSASTVGVPFRVKFFAGSVDSGTLTITLGETDHAPTDDLFDVSPVFFVGPEGLEFAGGGQVSLPWTVPSGSVPRDLAVYYAASAVGPWERIEDSYTNAGFEQATLSRSGYFVVAYPKSDELAACP